MVGRKTRVLRKSVKEQGGWGCAVCLPIAPGCTRGLGIWQQALARPPTLSPVASLPADGLGTCSDLNTVG